MRSSFVSVLLATCSTLQSMSGCCSVSFNSHAVGCSFSLLCSHQGCHSWCSHPKKPSVGHVADMPSWELLVP